MADLYTRNLNYELYRSEMCNSPKNKNKKGLKRAGDFHRNKPGVCFSNCIVFYSPSSTRLINFGRKELL